MSFAAIGVTLAAISTGVGAASAAGAFSPSQPNLAASSAQMAQTEAELLPIIRAMQAQAEIGGVANLPGFTTKNYTAAQAASARQSIQQQIAQLTADSQERGARG